MNFLEFIESLDEKDKENYYFYSKFRGTQLYRIIYETLKSANSNVSYKDVNSFVRYDKAIKDVLFKYLGSLEEYIRNDIIMNYDFSTAEGLHEKYVFFNTFPKALCQKSNVKPGEITELYKRYSLNFGDMVSFIEEFISEKYNIIELNMIKELRNNVMHHSPLLFDCKFESKKRITEKQIAVLVKTLPCDYGNFMKEEINCLTNKTKSNIKNEYFDFLLNIY